MDTKTKLVLIKNVDNSPDELTEEFIKFKESLPENSQMSMFDIIVHEEEETWFQEALKKIEEKE